MELGMVLSRFLFSCFFYLNFFFFFILLLLPYFASKVSHLLNLSILFASIFLCFMVFLSSVIERYSSPASVKFLHFCRLTFAPYPRDHRTSSLFDVTTAQVVPGSRRRDENFRTFIAPKLCLVHKLSTSLSLSTSQPAINIVSY